MNDRPTIAERYLVASSASNLRLIDERQTAADVLMAAGHTAQRSRDADLALMIWSMRDSKRHHLFEQALTIIIKRLHHRRRKTERIGKHAYETCGRTLWWWIEQPVCRVCDGRGHPVIDDTPVLDTSRLCPSCDGHGLEPLERVVRQDWIKLADDVLADIQALESLAAESMVYRLRGRV